MGTDPTGLIGEIEGQTVCVDGPGDMNTTGTGRVTGKGLVYIETHSVLTTPSTNLPSVPTTSGNGSIPTGLNEPGLGYDLGPELAIGAMASRFAFRAVEGVLSRTLVAKAAEMRPYGGPGGGHHVPAKSAFVGAAGYDATQALAIPNATLARLGVSHSAITGAQMTGYRAIAQSGEAITWEAIQSVETNALIRGGMSPTMARETVMKAIKALKNAGVAGPTRIPWGR